jgi:hypothetical protein
VVTAVGDGPAGTEMDPVAGLDNAGELVLGRGASGALGRAAAVKGAAAVRGAADDPASGVETGRVAGA